LSSQARAHAEAIGKSRGGRTTKLHAIVDQLGRLRRFCLTGGHEHDMIAVDPLLLDHDAPAGTVIADKAYDAHRLRAALAATGRRAVIPFRITAKAPEPLDHSLYAERNLIERAFNRLKDYRRIATRFDKLARNFAAAVALTALRIWYLI
jgi:transposase